MNRFKVGLDVGSTTAKIVAIDNKGEIKFSKYIRHCADVSQSVISLFEELKQELNDCKIELSITGSVGMGIAERYSISFIQEVTATVEVIKSKFPDISTIIDIGGEDSKIVYLQKDGNIDLRMNGNCAGGTGSFIDQMATLLNVSIDELNTLAQNSKRIHPIASRCGVFSKTDIQNLISKNVDREDIAMSVFHAVAVQTIVTLSHGFEIEPKILFCGGPLNFITSLRKAFVNYLNINQEDTITPPHANLFPAWGAAICNENKSIFNVDDLLNLFKNDKGENIKTTERLQPLFESEEQYTIWKEEKESTKLKRQTLKTTLATFGLVLILAQQQQR